MPLVKHLMGQVARVIGCFYGYFVWLGFSVPAHVSAFNHSQIISVHGYSCTVLSPEIRAIAGMVMISMSYYDELEISRLAARTFKFFPKVGTLGWKPGINQDITCVGFYQVAIYATEINGFDLRSHLNLLLLDFSCRRESELGAHHRTGPTHYRTLSR
jgi:hypothetical protein